MPSESSFQEWCLPEKAHVQGERKGSISRLVFASDPKVMLATFTEQGAGRRPARA